MNKKLKTACILLYIIAGIAVAYGCVYMLIQTLLPYHQRYIGIPFDQLPPKVASLFLLIYRGVGSAMLSLGFTLAMLVKGLLSKGNRWAWWTILVMMSIVLIPMQFITRAVGPYTPWWGITLLILAMAYALYLAWGETKPD
jgi:hypothetical protein